MTATDCTYAKEAVCSYRKTAEHVLHSSRRAACLYAVIMPLERVRHARDGPPGAGAADEGVQPAARLAQDLRAGAQVRPEVGQILELVCEKRCAGGLLRSRLRAI